ncbi:AbrB/MazE/SpoVT family DNA-binding domain-containing protein [Turneriella parva]|uniref:Transcriptional regulator, AbrB family n=1 Tax=Turneriella parva (strain ATCC BAA-1111 / DSM 21527 / NCTC 11395 / H) TaxID=869212 RepID=I4B6X1_TURPD|nr:AbrB/MazE/SpoVT family DNA-binding domain-containing protein [Turneriella parva]AFM13028.1 transcriptional regulator, AbrB family [Turneriella parva DSM 21527]
MSAVTAKYQATLPKPVREKLQLKAGDKVTFSIENDRVYIQKATGFDVPYLRSLETTLEEWASPEDEEAYKNL